MIRMPLARNGTRRTVASGARRVPASVQHGQPFGRSPRPGRIARVRSCVGFRGPVLAARCAGGHQRRQSAAHLRARGEPARSGRDTSAGCCSCRRARRVAGGPPWSALSRPPAPLVPCGCGDPSLPGGREEPPAPTVLPVGPGVVRRRPFLRGAVTGLVVAGLVAAGLLAYVGRGELARRVTGAGPAVMSRLVPAGASADARALVDIVLRAAGRQAAVCRSRTGGLDRVLRQRGAARPSDVAASRTTGPQCPCGGPVPARASGHSDE